MCISPRTILRPWRVREMLCSVLQTPKTTQKYIKIHVHRYSRLSYTNGHPSPTITLVEIHRSRGAPLKDYILGLQKIPIFSILSLWWQLAQNKCHQRVFQPSADDFYFWVFQNRLSSRKVMSVLWWKWTYIWLMTTDFSYANCNINTKEVGYVLLYFHCNYIGKLSSHESNIGLFLS